MPGRSVVDEVVADQTVGHGLDGDRDPAVGARAVGERVGAPLADAVDVDADAEVLAGHVAGPVGAGADHDGGRVGGLGVDLLDASAQVGAGAQRGEEVEEVGREAAAWWRPRRHDRTVGRSRTQRSVAARGGGQERRHGTTLPEPVGEVLPGARESDPGYCSMRTNRDWGGPMSDRVVRRATQIRLRSCRAGTHRRTPRRDVVRLMRDDWPTSRTGRWWPSPRRCPATPGLAAADGRHGSARPCSSRSAASSPSPPARTPARADGPGARGRLPARPRRGPQRAEHGGPARGVPDRRARLVARPVADRGEAGVEAEQLSRFAELVFAYIDELSAASASPATPTSWRAPAGSGSATSTGSRGRCVTGAAADAVVGGRRARRLGAARRADAPCCCRSRRSRTP